MIGKTVLRHAWKNAAFGTRRSFIEVGRREFGSQQRLFHRQTNLLRINSFKTGNLTRNGITKLHGTKQALFKTKKPLSTNSSSIPSSNMVKSDKLLGAWLIGVSGAVFGMIVLGGVTRLTRSGLSMVDWRPQGSSLPSTDEEWELEFEKYKAFPEYKRLNMGMSLEEFKEIYFMEWLHRMWGRGLGIIFGVPLVYFLASGRAGRIPGLKANLAGLFCLGGAQGLVGWWMVKSGLEEPKNQYKEPRVSPYRLTAHLSVALVIFSGLLWNGLTALHPNKLAGSSAVGSLKKKGLVTLAIAGITFVSGAFVAGNDAGHAYNDWPLFAGEIIPNEIWDPSLGVCNFFENTATVQFDHRNLAYLTLLTTIGTWMMARKASNWGAISSSAQLGYKLMLAAVFTQVTLGISTLMMFVPVPLASAHQAGALTLWSTILYTQHALRYVR